MILLPALKALEFRSNNAMYQPIIQGLETVKRYADTKLRYYPSDEQIPLDLVPPLWRDEGVERDANGNQRVHRITYEITVLDAVRDRVRRKEVWIMGADPYRNPDDDVPADFALRREEHSAALKLPLDPETFASPYHRRLSLHIPCRFIRRTTNVGFTPGSHRSGPRGSARATGAYRRVIAVESVAVESASSPTNDS